VPKRKGDPVERIGKKLLSWASILEPAARGQASRTASTAMAGIEWRHTDAFLDEIPQAYKPVDQVMADARDLVEIRHTLRQIVNVKGE
jgi:tRNA-splicing ligase RtcB